MYTPVNREIITSLEDARRYTESPSFSPSHQFFAVLNAREIPREKIEGIFSPYQIWNDASLGNGRTEIAYVLAGPSIPTENSRAMFERRLEAVLENPDLQVQLITCRN